MLPPDALENAGIDPEKANSKVLTVPVGYLVPNQSRTISQPPELSKVVVQAIFSDEVIKSLLPANRGIELEHLQMVRLRQGRQVLGRNKHELPVRHLARHIHKFLHRDFARDLVHEHIKLVQKARNRSTDFFT